VPDADTVVPLCSYAALLEGAFSDLFSGFSQNAANDILLEATRQCEDQTGRRLAPFTVTETIRASGMDPDEYGGTSNMPLSIQGTLGMSEAAALNMTNLIRHAWISQYPPRYQDLWTPPSQAALQVTVVRSYGGTQALSPGQILDGPDNTGHVWFQLGQFIPVASRLRFTYSGGYTVAVPGSLLRACKFMAAAVAIDELNPGDNERDPDRLYNLALRWLAPFAREGSPLALRMRG
jgi:hypothetical protein